MIDTKHGVGNAPAKVTDLGAVIVSETNQCETCSSATTTCERRGIRFTLCLHMFRSAEAVLASAGAPHCLVFEILDALHIWGLLGGLGVHSERILGMQKQNLDSDPLRFASLH